MKSFIKTATFSSEKRSACRLFCQRADFRGFKLLSLNPPTCLLLSQPCKAHHSSFRKRYNHLGHLWHHNISEVTSSRLGLLLINFDYHDIGAPTMTSTGSRPYELPPFEVVKLIQPAFASTASTSTNPVSFLSGTTSPPGSLGFSPSPPGPSFSNRLSQLVNAKIAAPQQRPGQAVEISISAESNTAPVIAASKKQTIRVAEAGGDTVYLAGNEGSVAVWKLDPARAKGKQRAVELDEQVTNSAEEVCGRHIKGGEMLLRCVSSSLHIFWISIMLFKEGDLSKNSLYSPRSARQFSYQVCSFLLTKNTYAQICTDRGRSHYLCITHFHPTSCFSTYTRGINLCCRPFRPQFIICPSLHHQTQVNASLSRNAIQYRTNQRFALEDHCNTWRPPKRISMHSRFHTLFTGGSEFRNAHASLAYFTRSARFAT